MKQLNILSVTVSLMEVWHAICLIWQYSLSRVTMPVVGCLKDIPKLHTQTHARGGGKLYWFMAQYGSMHAVTVFAMR